MVLGTTDIYGVAEGVQQGDALPGLGDAHLPQRRRGLLLDRLEQQLHVGVEGHRDSF